MERVMKLLEEMRGALDEASEILGPSYRNYSELVAEADSILGTWKAHGIVRDEEPDEPDGDDYADRAQWNSRR